ncbi:hypothetical protein DSO57_1008437 [Entomophthora muscae]|uniref:Uncharacterized protein n=1 Tax=Entomophthora muscae TaxID=34485 RepID=A0ACC2T746_9FUNG|nr:hypothetical protein DSO57_1008437 [Entomophthora muscae]
MTLSNVSGALMEEFSSEEALNNCKMDFVKGGIKKGETMQGYADRFYLEAQTLISLKAALFIDVKSAWLNAVRPNKNISLALKSGIYGTHSVSELICHLLTFKKTLWHLYLPQPELLRKTDTGQPLLRLINPNQQLVPLLLVLWLPLALEHVLSVENLVMCLESAKKIPRYTI